MRIIDLLLPFLDGVERIVEAYSGEIVLRNYLGPAASLPYEKTQLKRLLEDSDEPSGSALRALDASDLLLSLVGAPSNAYDDMDAFLDVLGQVSANGAGLMLSGWEPEELPLNRLIQKATQHSCQLLLLGELDYQLIRTGVVFARVDHLQTPRFLHGRDVKADDPDKHLQLRIANELLVESFIHRSTRRHVRELETRAAGFEAERNRSAGLETRLAEVLKATADRPPTPASGDVRAYRKELAEAQRRIQVLEDATSLKVGRAIAGAARGPARERLKLPRELVHIWKERKEPPAPSRSAAGSQGPSAQRTGAEGISEESSPPQHLETVPSYLRHTQVQVRAQPGFTIAAIARPPSYAALQEHCVVNLMRPHDAMEVLDATQPDFVFVEAAALRPGLPWAGTGDATSVERDRQLQAVSDVAIARGIPLALWANGYPGEAPGLRQLTPNAFVLPGTGSDRTQAWDTGVSLRRYNPIAIADDRSMEPLLIAPGFDPGGRILRRWLQAVGEELAPRSIWQEMSNLNPDSPGEPLREDDAPSLFRSSGIALLPPEARPAASAVSRVLELVACGAWVVDAYPDGSVGGRRPVHDLKHLRDTLEGIAEKGPRGLSEVWKDLRHIFSARSTGAMLNQLTQFLGLEKAPDAAGQISVITDRPIGAEFVDSISCQTVRPTEVILVSDDASNERALDEIQAIGVQVKAVQSPEDASDSWWYRGVTTASAPWVSLWTDRVILGNEWFRDQLIAAETSGAAIVGEAQGRSCGFMADITNRAPMFRSSVLPRNVVGNASQPADIAAEAHRRGTTVFGFLPEFDDREGR